MKKLLTAAIAVLFSLLCLSSALAVNLTGMGEYVKNLGQSAIVDQANRDTNNHFTETNSAGKPLRMHEVYLGESGQVQGPIFDIIQKIGSAMYVLTWGDPHNDPGEGDKNGHKRYIGYTYLDEDFTNPAFPHDAWGGGVLEDRHWIETPWENDTIKTNFGVQESKYDSHPELYLRSMQFGLAAYYADVLDGVEKVQSGNKVKYIINPNKRPEFWYNLADYVHVLVPPSAYTWGMGRMWHQKDDGTIWYASVPIAPTGMTFDADVSVDIEPKEVKAKPSEEVSFTATVKVKKAPSGIDQFGQQTQYTAWPANVWAHHIVNDYPYFAKLEPQQGSPPIDELLTTGDLEEGREYKYNLKVQAQNMPTTVEVWGFPDMALDENQDDNVAEAKINIEGLVNLVAVSINPGVSGEAEPDTRYTGTVVFKNDSDQPLENVPVGVFHREYRAVLKDASGNEVQYTSFGPREEKTFWFNWTAPTAGTTRLTAVIDTPPLENKYQEITEDDNKKQVDIGIRDVDNSSPGDRRLNLQAYSKPGEDIYGEWHDARTREPFTAKWTDDVHATLTVDRPTPPRGWLDWWEISWAKITYPRVADDFSFGNPVPPDGTVTKWMDVPGKGLEDQKQAKIVFEEDWALDGFGIHNMMTGEDMAVNPKHYPVSVQFKVTYQYSYIVCVCGKDGCTCWVETRTASYTDTASANLLVNGAGTIPYAS